jgi:UDP-glucose 4-epimerase
VAGVADEPQLADARLGDVLRSALDAGLANHELRWQAQVSLADGLRETFAWMQESGSVKPK